MLKKDILIIKDCLLKYGDDFWSHDDEIEISDGVITSNVELIYDIIDAVNKAGYDLKLIKNKN
jgi:hypothetical protein